MKNPFKISENLDVLKETDLLIIAKPRFSFSEKELYFLIIEVLKKLLFLILK